MGDVIRLKRGKVKGEEMMLKSVRDPAGLTVGEAERLRNEGAYLEMKDGRVLVYVGTEGS